MSLKEQVQTTLKRYPTMTLAQVLYLRYFSAILVDLVVMGLLNEYWSKVEISSFTVALCAAVLLQILLQVSFFIEEKSAGYFKKKSGKSAKTMRIVSAWAILFVSKLVILWALDVLFGESFRFHGWYHGVIPFLVLIFTMIIAEMAVRGIFSKLGKDPVAEES